MGALDPETEKLMMGLLLRSELRSDIRSGSRGRASALSRRAAPELCVDCHPRSEEGAGKAGCALHPRSRVQGCTMETHTSIQVQRRHPAFPAQWFLPAYTALSPVTGLSCHRRPREISRELDASVGAAGPRGFAVRSSHARQSQLPRPPHPTARS